MYKLVVYKKSSGCSQCAVLDRITPTIKGKYPEVAWEYVVIDPEDKDVVLPSFVGGFPTSVFYKDDEKVFVHPGYDGLAKKLHGILRAES